MKKLYLAAALWCQFTTLATAGSNEEILLIYDLVESEEYALANELLQPYLDAGDLDAIGLEGIMYYYGMGREEDEVRAFDLCSQSAEAEQPMGLHCLGHIYDNGTTAIAVDHIEANYWWSKAVAAGDLESMTHLGNNYLFGYGIEADEAEGIALLTQAATGGEKYALYQLGDYYGLGLFVDQDLNQKQVLWEQALAQGDTGYDYETYYEMKLWLANRYLESDDDQLIDTALIYLEDARADGYHPAIYRLGYLCLSGTIIYRDLACALEMYRKTSRIYPTAHVGLWFTYLAIALDSFLPIDETDEEEAS